MTIKVEVNTSDLKRLAGIHGACFAEGWDALALRDMLSVPGTTVVQAGEAGFALLRILAGEAEILTVAVLPGARRSGIGRELVSGMLDTARERGATSLFLEVAEDNAAALALYASAGFTVISRRRGYYARPGGSSMDAIVMRRVL